MLDWAAWETQLAQSTIVGRATLLSIGGRAFLNATPSGRTQMEPAAFLSELRVRLQVPDAASDTWCPLCDAVLDHHSHHAGMCIAGGEHTQRHHAVRDLVHTWCQRAGLRPEREKSGLLLPNGPEDTNSSQARRPADVYLPTFAGSPTAFDFAVTAPQRQETLAQASVHTAAAAEAHARHKELHLHTAQACEQQGVKFVPMVAECTGAWDPSALKVLKHVDHAVAIKTGEEPAACYNKLLQELGNSFFSGPSGAAAPFRSLLKLPACSQVLRAVGCLAVGGILRRVGHWLMTTEWASCSPFPLVAFCCSLLFFPSGRWCFCP